MNQQLWTIKQAADWAQVKWKTLYIWRSRHRGDPKYDFPCTDEKPLRIVPNEFMSWYLNRKH